MDGWMDGWMEGWKDDAVHEMISVLIIILLCETKDTYTKQYKKEQCRGLKLPPYWLFYF